MKVRFKRISLYKFISFFFSFFATEKDNISKPNLCFLFFTPQKGAKAERIGMRCCEDWTNKSFFISVSSVWKALCSRKLVLLLAAILFTSFSHFPRCYGKKGFRNRIFPSRPSEVKTQFQTNKTGETCGFCSSRKASGISVRTPGPLAEPRTGYNEQPNHAKR